MTALDAGGSTDADDDLSTFLWEFGDGSIAKDSLASVKQIRHTYVAEGVYSARLTVFDMRGQSSTAQLSISVQEGPGQSAPAGGAPACGFGAGLPLSVGLVGLVGMKRRRRIRRGPG